jgi:predicted nucleic acid-binding protein
MYLLDTDVLSALRKQRRDASLVRWIGSVAEADLHLSAITVAEIERGIERQRKPDPTFANDLTTWLEFTLRAYGERILPLTVSVARRWGRLSAQIGNEGLDLGLAATALEHGLTIVTGNTRHFQQTGAALLNPFTRQPRK